jgi:Na+-transporting NADH:ubiquinone oxidoreductase subunit C
VKGSVYTLGYAAVLGTVCALLLTAAASFTKPYKEANEKAEEALNILLALKVPLPAEISSKQVVELRKENVEEKEQGDITTYVYSPPEANGKALAVAVRFSGRGLWGPIKGFLALKPDMKTIVGITFYEQEETPGLGGEIASREFREQFEGKSIIGPDGTPGIIIRMGGEDALNKVDGISGATMTCDKVQAMLNEAIKSIVKEK